MYEFRNQQNRTMAAQAIPSYAPKQASPYFNKLECFCFNEYTLAPGEIEAVAGGVRDRSEAAAGRRDDHAVVYLLRGRRRVPPAPEAVAAVGNGAARERVGNGLRARVRRKVSFVQTMKAVAWSFFGVRKSADYERDVEQLNPVHLAIAGVHRRADLHRGVAVAGELGVVERSRGLKAPQ